MSTIIEFPARTYPATAHGEPEAHPLPEIEREALARIARDLDLLEPAARRPLAALLAAIDETGEIRAMRRARAAAAYERTARPANGASWRLRNRLSSSWLPTMSAAS
ncbi:MAG: hypothetical protein IT303_02570 [Dehalococcoidia bacterium]|nr:hypothetical protein [Dehalococcoidia bacterium]